VPILLLVGLVRKISAALFVALRRPAGAPEQSFRSWHVSIRCRVGLWLWAGRGRLGHFPVANVIAR
jgi:hypothetical protein